MDRPERRDAATPAPERELPELHESVGYARCEAEQAEQALARLRSRQQDLLRQVKAVEGENRAIEQELLQKLATWRQRDDDAQKVDEVVGQMRAITGSLTYRVVAALLRRINAVRRWLLPRRG